jgi:putative transposase
MQGRRFTARSISAFAHHGVPDDVIALAVRPSVRYRLRYADGAAWFAECGLTVGRRAIYRWVQHFLPCLAMPRVCIAERSVKSGGLTRPMSASAVAAPTSSGRIDQDGHVVDASVSDRRNAAAAEALFQRAIGATCVTPKRVITDKATCYPPALRTVLPTVEHRRSRSRNNGVERDHGHLKQRLYPMRGFTRAASAVILACGHALMRNVRDGVSTLTVTVARQLRRAAAWGPVTKAI